jgi:hypothetical protein
VQTTRAVLQTRRGYNNEEVTYFSLKELEEIDKVYINR